MLFLEIIGIFTCSRFASKLARFFKGFLVIHGDLTNISMGIQTIEVPSGDFSHIDGK